MTTFVLKKYTSNDDASQTTQLELDKPEISQTTPEENKELTISVSGSMSEIIANALNAAFKNNIEIAKYKQNAGATEVKAVSTEDINSRPIETLQSIKNGDIVFIGNKGFNTAKEEWFLTNIPNKASNVFYTVESFIKYVSCKLGVKCES